MNILKKMIAGSLASLLLMCGTAAFGEDSDAIRSVQEGLRSIHLLEDSDVTGEWDDSSRLAMLRFQRFVNNAKGEGSVEETGEIDDSITGYLEFATTQNWDISVQVSEEEVRDLMPAPEPGQGSVYSSEDEAYIALVQVQLRDLGLIKDLSGEFDTETQNAIASLQKYVNDNYEDADLKITGYCDSETLIWLSRATMEGWHIDMHTNLSMQAPDPETAVREDPNARTEQQAESGEAAPDATAAPAITDFVLTLDGVPVSGPINVQSGTHAISWSAKGVSMFSMYLYTGDGTLVGQQENIQGSSFNLSTDGMAPGAVYEVRIGAVPQNGDLAQMQWRSIFMKLEA